MSTQIESRAQRLIAEDIAKLWARRPQDVQSVSLLEPDAAEGARVAAEMALLGVQVDTHTDPLRVVAHVGVSAHVVSVSARLGADVLESFVEVVRAETSAPVLIAHGSGDLATIRSAVMAGGRPLIALPYDARQVAQVLREVTPAAVAPSPIHVGDLALTPGWYDVHFGGHAVDLSPIEFDLLLALAVRGGGVVPRPVLVESLWPGGGAGKADVLAAAVMRVRKKLLPLGIHEALQTVRGVGYRLDPHRLVAVADT